MRGEARQKKRKNLNVVNSPKKSHRTSVSAPASRKKEYMSRPVAARRSVTLLHGTGSKAQYNGELGHLGKRSGSWIAVSLSNGAVAIGKMLTRSPSQKPL